MSAQGLQLIKHFEGFVPTRYICPAGFWTIGIGHAIRKGEKWDTPTATITYEEALALLDKDNNEAEYAVERLIKVPLTDGQFDALVSFAFNLGSGALQRSTLRSRLNREEYLGAAEEFNKWIWGGGRILPGLIKRRKAEQMMFLTGVLLV
jgi:lysozyme